MSRTRKDEAPVLVEAPEIEGRYVELDDTTVAFERFPVDVDPAPLFRACPTTAASARTGARWSWAAWRSGTPTARRS
jgi:hypothetical protein